MRKSLRWGIYRRSIAAMLGCSAATALAISLTGIYLFRDAYDAARESCMAETLSRVALYDYLVAGFGHRAKAAAEAALRALGETYRDSSAIPGATAAALRADAARLGAHRHR